MGLEISKCYSPYGFRLISAKLLATLATVVEYSLLLFLAITQVLSSFLGHSVCDL